MADIGDPIAFELFKNAIFSIADEMALTVMRTTYSGVLKDNMDFSTALVDADGKLVAQGLTLPGHLGSIPTAMESIMRQFGDIMGPGDIFIMNDPFDGGMHLPDIFVIKPIYVDGRRRGQRRRQADPPVRHPHQTGKPPDRRLDWQLAAGEGRDQQHAVVHQGGDLLRYPLRPA